uniref:J domain-containing protein n=1 Tax=Alexandrium monilatum TaxID=311494 RepID=A0A7S4PY57_9DINO
MAPGFEIPWALRSGDREDALGRILEARTPTAALLGSAGAAWDPAERLGRFRHLVNQVHPDRCVDPRATAALEQASRAYDALCAADASGGSAEEARELWLADLAGTRPSTGSRWWHSSSVAELDRLLEFRGAASRALRVELAPQMNPAGLARLSARVVDAERACECLDRACGFERHRLWPVRKRPLPPDAGEGADSAIDAPASDGKASAWAQRGAARLVDLLSHLRGVHRFCLLRGRAFDHQAELAAASPPASVGALLLELLGEGRAEAVTITCGLRAPDAGEGVDPLDAYMEVIEAELRELPVAGTKAQTPPAAGPVSVDTPSAAPQAAGPGPAADPRVGPADCTVPTPPQGLSVAAAAACTDSAVAAAIFGSAGHGAAAAWAADGAGRAAPSLAPAYAANRPAAPEPGAGMRLATGGLVRLPAADGAPFAREPASEGEAARGLQDRLLGGLDSDESELEEG